MSALPATSSETSTQIRPERCLLEIPSKGKSHWIHSKGNPYKRVDNLMYTRFCTECGENGYTDAQWKDPNFSLETRLTCGNVACDAAIQPFVYSIDAGLPMWRMVERLHP